VFVLAGDIHPNAKVHAEELECIQDEIGIPAGYADKNHDFYGSRFRNTTGEVITFNSAKYAVATQRARLAGTSIRDGSSAPGLH
jgi:hypothetical protein